MEFLVELLDITNKTRGEIPEGTFEEISGETLEGIPSGTS